MASRSSALTCLVARGVGAMGAGFIAAAGDGVRVAAVGAGVGARGVVLAVGVGVRGAGAAGDGARGAVPAAGAVDRGAVVGAGDAVRGTAAAVPAFFATVFFAGAFFATVFFATGAFFATTFFATGAFLATAFFVTVFLVAVAVTFLDAGAAVLGFVAGVAGVFLVTIFLSSVAIVAHLYLKTGWSGPWTDRVGVNPGSTARPVGYTGIVYGSQCVCSRSLLVRLRGCSGNFSASL